MLRNQLPTSRLQSVADFLKVPIGHDLTLEFVRRINSPIAPAIVRIGLEEFLRLRFRVSDKKLLNGAQPV